MFKFLLVVQAIVTLTLITVILMQRSEGGGLGIGGGSPSGLMSARGAADFLTRATSILAALFIILSIVLAGLASVNRSGGEIDTSLAKGAAQTAPAVPAPGSAVPLEGAAPAAANDPLAAAAAAKAAAEQKGAAQPAPAQNGVPLQQ